MHHPNTGERRAVQRMTVDLWVEERAEDALYFQRATNLSLGGLYLAGTLPHPPGTRVALELRLPGEDLPLRLTAEVVEAANRDTGMGVKFVGLDFHTRARIADYLMRTSTRSACSPGGD